LRTLGDADDDGDVDECDRHWYEFERGLRPAPPTLPADNCNALAMHDAAGDTYYIVDGDAALEPIPQPQFVVVEEGYYPYPRSRAVAVAQILLIAETRWYGGRPEDALHIWAGMTRVYGKQIIPEWAASLLD
jgi:hypothetical protein